MGAKAVLYKAVLYFARMPYVHNWEDLEYYAQFHNCSEVLRSVREAGWYLAENEWDRDNFKPENVARWERKNKVASVLPAWGGELLAEPVPGSANILVPANLLERARHAIKTPGVTRQEKQADEKTVQELDNLFSSLGFDSKAPGSSKRVSRIGT